ncbi:MAG: MerR family transcriptional regulator [Rhodospirillaceae bacterium]|nr:MerR family transcriptional regulator [Rhodospirillaceae bacterium]
MSELSTTSAGTRARGHKSPSAYRTISEVSGELDIPQHVLRFWETRFSQVQPLKRGGGRRYYRPEDVRLLKRIQKLLYEEGYTIRGVQKLLREGRIVPSEASASSRTPMTPPLFSEAADEPDGTGDPGPEDGVPEGEGDETGEASGLSTDVRSELKDILSELKTLRTMLNEGD